MLLKAFLKAFFNCWAFFIWKHKRHQKKCVYVTAQKGIFHAIMTFEFRQIALP